MKNIFTILSLLFAGYMIYSMVNDHVGVEKIEFQHVYNCMIATDTTDVEKVFYSKNKELNKTSIVTKSGVITPTQIKTIYVNGMSRYEKNAKLILLLLVSMSFFWLSRQTEIWAPYDN